MARAIGLEIKKCLVEGTKNQETKVDAVKNEPSEVKTESMEIQDEIKPGGSLS